MKKLFLAVLLLLPSLFHATVIGQTSFESGSLSPLTSVYSADRSEACMDAFYKWLGSKKSRGIKIAVMDKSPYLHAARDLKWLHSTHSITR